MNSRSWFSLVSRGWWGTGWRWGRWGGAGLLLVGLLGCRTPARVGVHRAEVCVFGATSGGIAAAIQAQRMGRTVLLVEPGSYLGGLTTGGLGATDIGNKAAVGGVSLEFYRRIARHYARDEAWTIETREAYFGQRGSGQTRASSLGEAQAAMWTFEPRVAEKVYVGMLEEAGIRPHLRQKLTAVRKVGARVVEFSTETGERFQASIFIDATYEGDLMAKAGVSYHVGREANAVYGETLNGVRAETPHHQFIVAVDPYVRPGDPASGLLPFIQGGDGGEPGSGDRKVQAYNYRLCFTTNEANRLPLAPPPDYDPARYELLGRYFDALVAAGKQPALGQFWHPIWMPNQKTDINNNGGFSTDALGMNWNYPEASYAERERMAREHEHYIRGFLHYLATSPRVPENVRRQMQQWGPCRDEFQETGGWPRQLYVREARRLVGAYVMTEKNCRYQEVVPDSVGLAAYNMDSHNVQRIVKGGRVENEGDVQVPPMKPYPISYRALLPRAEQCDNLLVPVCLSSSHIAYGSIRMEPVFMILGQSAATAAVLALEGGVPLHELPYTRLEARLRADGQVLEWKSEEGSAPKAALIDPRSLPGVVLDDSQGKTVGPWVNSASAEHRRVGTGYIHDGNADKGERSVSYTPDLPKAGAYRIVLISVPHANRATNVPVTVTVNGQVAALRKVDQRSGIGNGFIELGQFDLPQGRRTTVTVANAGTDGYVVADGIQFLPVDSGR